MSAISPSPRESAQIPRWIRTAPNREAREIRLDAAPLPDGSSITFRVPRSAILDQDRIRPSPEMAAGARRVWGGVIASLRSEASSSSTTKPAFAQVLLRLNWFVEVPDKFRNFFVRAAAFSASYAPRIATGKPCTMKIGDVISGIVEKPNSERNSDSSAGDSVLSRIGWHSIHSR